MENTNTETGIRYGIINGNDVPYLLEDIFNKGVDESWEAFKKGRIAEIKKLYENLEGHGASISRKDAKDFFDELQWDSCESDESDYSYTDEEGNEFLISYLGGVPLIWCIKTDTIVQAKLCSPCVPNGGDLNNLDDQGFDCYGIPKIYLVEEEIAK